MEDAQTHTWIITILAVTAITGMVYMTTTQQPAQQNIAGQATEIRIESVLNQETCDWFFSDPIMENLDHVTFRDWDGDGEYMIVVRNGDETCTIYAIKDETYYGIQEDRFLNGRYPRPHVSYAE